MYFFSNCNFVNGAVSDFAVFDFPVAAGIWCGFSLSSLALAHFPAARTTLSVSLSLWKLMTPKNMTKGYKNKTRK